MVLKYDNVVGRDARKWANKLIKEHNLNIDDTPTENNYQSIIDRENKKKKQVKRENSTPV